MAKYEYDTQIINYLFVKKDAFRDTLNKLLNTKAEEGWEFVSMNSTDWSEVVVFRREKI